jgi:segregation and condensation protein A
MTAPPISLPRFEGPLDLLLELVRRKEVDITEIPIAEITRQYLDYLESAADMDLELGSEFAFMAATLIQIKSRLLLPPDPEMAVRETDPRQEIIRELLDREQLRQATEFLHQQMELAAATWTHGSMEEFRAVAEEEDEARDPGVMNLHELLRLARKAVETARAHDALGLDTAEVSTAEMAAWLRERLEGAGPEERVVAEPLLAEQADRAHWVALFLAMLEMAKDGAVRLEQEELFGPLSLYKAHPCPHIR